MHTLPPLLSPGLFHRINVTCSTCLIKGRAGSSRETLWLVLFTSFFSSQEELSFIFPFFNLQPPMALKNYRDLGTCLSLAHLQPLLQISTNNTAARTGRRVLLSGGPSQYKSCVPPICAIVLGPARNPRNLLLPVREPRQLARHVGTFACHDIFGRSRTCRGQPWGSP
jgi:hypothetical protein